MRGRPVSSRWVSVTGTTDANGPNPSPA
jgi:hypothetical protein